MTPSLILETPPSITGTSTHSRGPYDLAKQRLFVFPLVNHTRDQQHHILDQGLAQQDIIMHMGRDSSPMGTPFTPLPGWATGCGPLKNDYLVSLCNASRPCKLDIPKMKQFGNLQCSSAPSMWIPRSLICGAGALKQSERM